MNQQVLTIEVRDGQVIAVYPHYGEVKVMVIDHDRGVGYWLPADRLHNRPWRPP